MIELRGLHLGNIARSPAESVRPDLWPAAGAWVPCLGPQMYDLSAHNGPATLSGGATYTAAGLNCLTTSVAAKALAPLRYQIGDGSTGAATTWVVACSTYALVANYEFIFVRRNATTKTGWQLLKEPDNSVEFDIFDLSTSGQLSVKSPGNAINGYQYFVVAVTYDGGSNAGGIALYINGSLSPITPSTVGTFVAPEPIYNSVVIGGWEASNFPFGGVVHAACIYDRALSATQIADVSADPVAPFRRRQPVYYSVPSGSGTARSLIAALAGESATGTISAIIARALTGDVTATSIAGAITASMARDLLASMQGQSATGDAAATMQRLLLASLGCASLTGDATAIITREMGASIAAASDTGDVTASLAALVELVANISGTTTTPAVAATMARALAANLAGQSATGAIAVEFAGMLLLVASIAGTSTTGALTATTGRELRAAIAAASSTGIVDGQLLRQIAATIAGASLTGSIVAELVNLVSLAASVVGVSVTPDVLAAISRDLAAEVAAGSTTGEASATVARTLAAAVEAGSLTPDNLVLILTGLGILHDTTIISRTPRRGITSRTVRRTLHSA